MLVIFDLDGTLFQTHITSVKATHEAMREYNLPEAGDREIIALFGEPMDVYCERLVPNMTVEERRSFADRINLYEKKYINECGILFDGIEDMLKCLKEEGHTLAVCSNGRHDYINSVLDTCKITKYFSSIKGREEGRSKSQAIGQIIRESNLAEGAVVGDRIHDIDAARENNLISIGVSYGYGGDEVEAADYKAGNAEDIIGILNRMNIFYEIAKSLKQNKPKVIGVNGVDTSGKTQFSKSLSRFLRALGYKTQLIHLDDFHNPSFIRSKGDNPIESYIENAFNLEMLRNEILEPIKRGYVIDKELTLLDLDADTFTNKKNYKIDEKTIVIIEGVLLYRSPIDEYFDMRIYLDISFEEVLRRAEIRDVPRYGIEFLSKYRNKYIPIQQRYIKECFPMEKSHIVINNNDFSNPVIKVNHNF